MPSIMKVKAAHFTEPFVSSTPEIFCDEPLSGIPSLDLKDVQRLSRFFPVAVLLPTSRADDQRGQQKISLCSPLREAPNPINILGVIGKAVESFKNTSAESAITFGNVGVDFSAMEVVREGERVMLTTLEFKAFKYLVQNEGRAISRDELLNEVWGHENYPCARTVDNHILRLRRKLERDPSRPVHLRTVRGVGYKFLS